MSYATPLTRFALFATIFFTLLASCSADSPPPKNLPYTPVSFKTQDGGTCHANLYTPNPGVKTDPTQPTDNPDTADSKTKTPGDHAVILAHGAIFNKESWHDLSITLTQNNIIALPIDFRTYGNSTPGSQPSSPHLDILAAITFLKTKPNIKRISLLGASMGGGITATAATKINPTDSNLKTPGFEIHKVILLAPTPIDNPQDIQGNKHFIVSQNDSFAQSTTQQHARATHPKKLTLIEGSAHAQHIFKTDQAQHLTHLIIQTLTTD